MHSKQFFRLSKSISFLWLSMHNSWIDSAERFSHTTFLHTKFARNWRHEPPGRTLPIAFSIGWQCTVNYHTSHNLNHMHEWTTTHSQRGREGVCVYISPLLSFLSDFYPFSFANILFFSLLYKSMWIYDDRVTLKGTRLMHMHRQLCHQSCVAHDEFIGHGVSVVYRGKRGDITPLFRSARSRSFMFDQRRGWAEPKESVRCQRRKLQRKCCATGYYNIISHRYLDLVIEMTRRINIPFWFHHRLLEIIYIALPFS